MEYDRWQNCFILHSQPYGDSDVVLDTFAAQYGRITLLAKGVKRNRHPWHSLLVPFTPLLIIWRKKHNHWKKIIRAEALNPRYIFSYRPLVCAMYLNELLGRLLIEGTDEGADKLFNSYKQALDQLARLTSPSAFQQSAPILRDFERVLLENIGYGIDFDYASDRTAILAQNYYYYDLHQGFQLVTNQTTSHTKHYLGATLTKIKHHQWDEQALTSAKSLFTDRLRELLGPKPLISRQLYK